MQRVHSRHARRLLWHAHSGAGGARTPAAIENDAQILLPEIDRTVLRAIDRRGPADFTFVSAEVSCCCRPNLFCLCQGSFCAEEAFICEPNGS